MRKDRFETVAFSIRLSGIERSGTGRVCGLFAGFSGPDQQRGERFSYDAVRVRPGWGASPVMNSSAEIFLYGSRGKTSRRSGGRQTDQNKTLTERHFAAGGNVQARAKLFRSGRLRCGGATNGIGVSRMTRITL